jgi:lipopolysaccharide transport system ATP-binding protein
MSAISIQNVSKKYVITHQTRSDTLRDTLVAKAKTLTHLFTRPPPDSSEDFWALNDVSLEVQPGEVVGIIGKNGAGKSTLLKILSRITEPTKGRIKINGRVASLLEVGTGFHPELSGRENIFLNGAILGMTRVEIAQKFDEIVAFAEVERFLDTPVKRYSSGMYVRLAFAVAAHLEPEILIVDEVLAVGDTTFRKKCMGKMQAVASTGRTVLFVSHDISAISSLTSRCVLLEQGKVVKTGPTEEVIARYLEDGSESATSYKASPRDDGRPNLTHVFIESSEGLGLHAAGKPLKLNFEISHPKAIKDACFSFQIVDQNRRPATHAWAHPDTLPFAQDSGTSILQCTLPITRLNVGHYALNVYLSEPPGGAVFETLESICAFEVVRLEPPPLWGWRADACVYHEDNRWVVKKTASADAQP